MLLRALARLVERGHGVLVVEHHLDVMAAADLRDRPRPRGRARGRARRRAGHARGGRPRRRPHGAAPARRARGARRPRPRGRAVVHGAVGRRSPWPTAGRPLAPSASIAIEGAREHNLKDVDVRIPRDALVVVTGPSGSGKSTLAFDIVFAEGQRRYVETLSAYARQFVGPAAAARRRPRDRASRPRWPSSSARRAAVVALHGRHRDRDRALPAPALREDRRPALPRLRRARSRRGRRRRSSTGSLEDYRGEAIAHRWRPSSWGARASTARSSRRRPKRGHAEARVDGRPRRDRARRRSSRAGTSTTSTRWWRGCVPGPATKAALARRVDEALALGHGRPRGAAAPTGRVARALDVAHVPEGRDHGPRARPAVLQPQQPARLVPDLRGARHACRASTRTSCPSTTTRRSPGRGQGPRASTRTSASAS